MSVSPLFRPVPASRASKPSEDACIAAYDRELGYILATLRRLGVTGPDVEDLAQEIFIVLHKNWATIDTARPLRPYLFGVAFRVCCAHRRRRRREIPFETIELESAGDDPETAAQTGESAALVTAALDRVAFYRRAVIVMHDLDGIPVAEIAERLSMSRFAVYARLRKGRRELRSAVRRLMTRPRKAVA